MPEKELIKILTELSSKLNEYQELVAAKQKALVENDYQNLESITHSEEKILMAIEQTGRKRVDYMMKLSEKYNLPKNILKLSDLLEQAEGKMDEESFGSLSALSGEIKEKLHFILRTNEKNRGLIESSRSFIKEIITSVIGMKKRSLIDKKI